MFQTSTFLSSPAEQSRAESEVKASARTAAVCPPESIRSQGSSFVPSRTRMMSRWPGSSAAVDAARMLAERRNSESVVSFVITISFKQRFESQGEGISSIHNWVARPELQAKGVDCVPNTPFA